MIQLAMLSCGHVHTKGYCDRVQAMEGVRLSAIWDDMPDRGRGFAKQYQADYRDTLAILLEDSAIDGWIICSENTRHLPLLEAAIDTGKPIFCEKPFTTSVADAQQAMAMIRQTGTPVMMGYFQPFSPELRAIRNLLDQGALGEITHARFRNAHHAAYGRWFDSPANAWFTQPELAGGGAFMDMGAHAIHALRSLLGPAKRAWARITNISGIYPDVDDHGLAHLELDSGVLATVEAAWIQTGGPRGLEIVGSEATVYQTDAGGYVLGRPKQGPEPLPAADAKPTRVDRLVATIRGALSDEELSEDLACAADTVAITEACYQSSNTGQWVDVLEV